jgi:beta-N-acetylhexosaminidase
MKFKERIRKPKTILVTIIIIIIAAATVWGIYAYKNKVSGKNKYYIPFLNEKSGWADSTLAGMNLDEKIGQMLILQTDSSVSDLDSVKALIMKYKFGGMIIKEDTLSDIINVTNALQSGLKIPMLMGLNSPNGFPDFLKELAVFSSNSGIDMITDDTLINKYAGIITDYCKYTGTTLNCYPSFASLSENPSDSNLIKLVLSKSLIYLKSLQSKQMLSCLNGIHNLAFSQGDTSTAKQRELKPYRTIIESGVSAICIDTNNLKDKLSDKQIKLYLEKQLNFKGLIIANASSNSAIDQDKIKQFLMAGSDMLVINKEPKIGFETIKKLVQSGNISSEELNSKVKKILMAKFWAGLKKFTDLEYADTSGLINLTKIRKLSVQICEASITLAKNSDTLIPLIKLNQKQLFIACIGQQNLDQFTEQLRLYFRITSKFINTTKDDILKSLEPAGKFNTIIIALNNAVLTTEQYNKINEFTSKLNSKTRILVVNFGSLQTLKNFSKYNNIIQVYDNSAFSQKLAAQLIFGGVRAKGMLPYNIDNDLQYKQGITNTAVTRLKYTIPEEMNLSSATLSMIDSIVLDGISRGAMPGCQVFIAKEGKVIYNKGFGYTTYDKGTKIKWDNLYDIASLTKIAGTTLATMKMVEQGRMKLTDKLEKFFKDTKIDYSKIKPEKIAYYDTLYKDEVDTVKLKSEYKTISLNDSMIVVIDSISTSVTPKSNIFKVQIKYLLIHQSGISPSLPILKYIKFKDSTGNNYTKYFSYTWSKESPVKIADNMYLRKSYFDTLWNDTKMLRVYSKTIYQYSDVNMILLQMAIDSVNRRSIDKYLADNFYNTLGLQFICYKPLEKKIPRSSIAPTEVDAYWRKQVLQGNVHDPSAALLGGVAGNAGIFSNANDLGILFQMLLNGGKYGGVSYLSSSTINLFTSKQGDGYRGLGFDKYSKNNIIARSASPRSYGHTGFTGTCVWVDPDNKLVYVFLSNRVYPSVKNWKLNSFQIRQKVHQVVYDAIKEAKEKNP